MEADYIPPRERGGLHTRLRRDYIPSAGRTDYILRVNAQITYRLSGGFGTKRGGQIALPAFSFLLLDMPLDRRERLVADDVFDPTRVLHRRFGIDPDPGQEFREDVMPLVDLFGDL